MNKYLVFQFLSEWFIGVASCAPRNTKTHHPEFSSESSSTKGKQGDRTPPTFEPTTSFSTTLPFSAIPTEGRGELADLIQKMSDQTGIEMSQLSDWLKSVLEESAEESDDINELSDRVTKHVERLGTLAATGTAQSGLPRHAGKCT